MQNELKNSEIVIQTTVTKSAWQCPTISRIDIKRTMQGSGSIADLLNGPSPT